MRIFLLTLTLTLTAQFDGMGTFHVGKVVVDTSGIINTIILKTDSVLNQGTLQIYAKKKIINNNDTLFLMPGAGLCLFTVEDDNMTCAYGMFTYNGDGEMSPLIYKSDNIVQYELIDDNICLVICIHYGQPCVGVVNKLGGSRIIKIDTKY